MLSKTFVKKKAESTSKGFQEMNQALKIKAEQDFLAGKN
jgi:hypothetical protein